MPHYKLGGHESMQFKGPGSWSLCWLAKKYFSQRLDVVVSPTTNATQAPASTPTHATNSDHSRMIGWLW